MLLEQILVQSADPFIFMDVSGRIRVWNRGAERLFGWSRQEAIGQEVDIILPEVSDIRGDVEDLREGYAPYDDNAVVQNYETTLRTRSGARIPVKITVTLISDTENSILGSSITVRDISREHLLENQLRSRSGEMALLDAVVYAVQGSLDLDRILRIILTSVTAGSGLGFNRAILFLITDDYLEARLGIGVSSWEEANRFWPKVEQDLSLGDTIDFTLQSSIHETMHVQEIVANWKISTDDIDNVLIKCIRDLEPRVHDSSQSGMNGIAHRLGTENYAVMPLVHGGKAIGVIVADNAVTRRPIDEYSLRLLRLLTREASFAIVNGRLYEKLLERAHTLEEAYDRIRSQQKLIVQGQNMAALGQIAEAISHEMRNPLTPIGAFSRSIRRELTHDSPFTERLDTIIHEADRLERVVAAVSAMASPPRPVLEPVSLNQLVGEIFEYYKIDSQSHGIKLAVEIPSEMPYPHLDAHQWRQLFMNLVANAMIATPAGGTVTVRARQRDDGGFRITVADTGVGIPVPKIPKVFSAFYTATPTSDGMGLNVVAQIVKLHHGSIHVESAPNEGTQVHINVPGPEALHAWLQEQADTSADVDTADLNAVSVSAFRRA